jgi:AraC-like DNA-binding protein
LAHDQTRALLSRTKRLPLAILDWVKRTFDEAEFEGAKVKFKEAIREDWREAAKRLLTELEKADDTIIFLFDELPAMLDRIIEKEGEQAARDFLAWFRTIRLAQKDVLRRHRFIVAGSVGIDQILKRLGATDRLVDFTRLTVEPLDVETAKGLAGDLAATFNITWNTELAGRLFELIGAPVPYFIHIFFAILGQLPSAERARLTIADLERIYAERVLGPTCRQYFDHYSTRLRRYGPARERAAVAILRAVAGRCRVSRPALYDIFAKAYGKGASEQGFDEIMADLEYESYLRLYPATNEFQFLLKIMQDWWRRWYPPSTPRIRTSRVKASKIDN